MVDFFKAAGPFICSCSLSVPSMPTRYAPLSFFAALAVITLLTAAPAQAQEVVFTLRGASQTTPSVQRTDGTAAAPLVTDPAVVVNARHVTVDPLTGRLYWTDSGGSGGVNFDRSAIRRAEADGSGVVTLLQSEVDEPVGLILDADEAKMYWADPSNGTIQRANLDGTGLETLVSDLARPNDLALDNINDKLYWTESGAEFNDSGIPIGDINRVQRSNLDGSNVEEIVTLSSGSPDGVAVDAAGGKVYWKVSTDSSTPDQLRRADLNGSNPEDVLELGAFTQEFVLDLENERVYSTLGPDEIQVVNLDDTGAATFLDTGTNSQPAGIALVPPIVSATQAIDASTTTADFGATAVSIDFGGVTGAGDVHVALYAGPPASTGGIPSGNAVSRYRVVIDADANLAVGSGTQVRFSLAGFGGITVPEDVTVYSRASSATGDFAALPTSVDGSDLVADVTGFSEFVFASDNASNPLPVELASFEVVSSGENAVELTWRTLSETGNDRFEIERRTEETARWTSVGAVESRADGGTSTEALRYAFTDRDPPFTTRQLTYRLVQYDVDGSRTIAGTRSVTIGDPSALRMHGLFPNPTHGDATLRYEVPEARNVTVTVYDALGRRVQALVTAQEQRGRQELTVDTDALTSGVYFVRLVAGTHSETRRLVVVR